MAQQVGHQWMISKNLTHLMRKNEIQNKKFKAVIYQTIFLYTSLWVCDLLKRIINSPLGIVANGSNTKISVKTLVLL